MKNFAVFILSHGRPDNVVTFETLRKSGYTGAIYLVIDDLDGKREAYFEKFGREKVKIFDKKAIAKTTDQGDNFSDLRTTTHARNAIFDIARELGFEYFVQLDDDYTSFQYRFDGDFNYVPKVLKNLDAVFEAMLEFFIASGATSIAMAQGGDFIGGDESAMAERICLKRKAMNSFICSTSRPFKFLSRLNEDVNTYLALGSRGVLFFTANQVNLNQIQTQAGAGGMTDAYLKYGTYVKSFYSVMYQPSSVKVSILRGQRYSRIHHSINWNTTVPKILSESIRRV